MPAKSQSLGPSENNDIAEVGTDIHGRAAAANPYQAWIDTYAGEQFHTAVKATIEATDEVAATASESLRERMHSDQPIERTTSACGPKAASRDVRSHVGNWGSIGRATDTALPTQMTPEPT